MKNLFENSLFKCKCEISLCEKETNMERKLIFILFFFSQYSAENLPSSCLNSFKIAALKAHNFYREKHNVAPLILDDSGDAQKYAEKLASKNQGLKHSSNRINIGENLFAKFTTAKLNLEFCSGI